MKVGDKMYDCREGWGVIREIKPSGIYPVIVDFYMDTIEYTLKGKSNESDLVPLLRNYEYKIDDL